MDMVAFADAKITMTAGMTAIMLETDSEDALKKVFNECLADAKKGYAAELNRINRQRRETGGNAGILQGPAVTREQWIGMISKFLYVFGTEQRGQEEVRGFFEVMLQRAKERVDASKVR